MKEKKLTDEEIVKALECKVGGCMICESVNASCLYDMSSYCDHEKHLKDILDLIHRLQIENADQKAEIERLTEENGQLKGYNSGLEYENAELQKQVDELKEQNAQLSEMADYDKGHKEGYEHGEKTTAKEILILAEDYNCGEKDDIDNFMLALKERYGVEVE